MVHTRLAAEPHLSSHCIAGFCNDEVRGIVRASEN